MLAWLLAVPCLVSGMLLSAANKPTTLADIPKDLLLAILADNFVSVHGVSIMSKHFKKLLFSAVKSLYGIKCNGKVYFYYSTILCKFNSLQEHAYREHGESEAKIVLEGTPEYVGIKATLEAEFGACILYGRGRMIFSPELTELEMLYREKKTLALPYFLDENPCSHEWASCIQALVELGRFDLLSQMKFPHIEEREFRSLLSIPLPTAVIVAAARSLRRNQFFINLSKLVAHAILQDKDASVPEGCVPLFTLRYIHENHMAIPQNWVFTDGLSEQSISFWMYLIGKEAVEVQVLLDIILERGDNDTKYLARTFYQTVSSDAMPADKEDVFQAMLIRFCFSPHSNDYVRTNYRNMIARQITIGYQSIHALLDCGQSELIGQFVVDSSLNYVLLKGLVTKMCRLGEKNLPLLVQRYLIKSYGKSYYFKTLIKEGADDQCTQLVWDWIQSNRESNIIAEYCCLVPVHSLRRLMFEKDISVAAVQEILSSVQAYQVQENTIPKEAAILYTVMYWEAPEEVIIHFLDQLPPDCKFNPGSICRLSQSTKYSIQLWERFVKCGGLWKDDLKSYFEYYRPNLVSLFG